eukprot:gnl/Dysnectes_brevis/2257_a2643_678.p2 GENE.gnl/Dysnectes_brevis/2257_a2643_678~~gnl/Dysnectes_brevis/2257_a2643_678.p2  ORF type:complete len:252 (+),score=60.73 gnl/Dysnectes_brevis/2257_a2643_678:174-929(+)
MTRPIKSSPIWFIDEELVSPYLATLLPISFSQILWPVICEKYNIKFTRNPSHFHDTFLNTLKPALFNQHITSSFLPSKSMMHAASKLSDITSSALSTALKPVRMLSRAHLRISPTRQGLQHLASHARSLQPDIRGMYVYNTQGETRPLLRRLKFRRRITLQQVPDGEGGTRTKAIVSPAMLAWFGAKPYSMATFAPQHLDAVERVGAFFRPVGPRHLREGRVELASRTARRGQSCLLRAHAQRVRRVAMSW